MLPVMHGVVNETISIAKGGKDGTVATVQTPLLFTAVTVAGALMASPMPKVDVNETPKLASIIVWTLISQTRLNGNFESVEGALGMCVRMAMFVLTASMDVQRSVDSDFDPPANAQATLVYLRRAFELALRHYSRMKRRAAPLDDSGISA